MSAGCLAISIIEPRKFAACVPLDNRRVIACKGFAAVVVLDNLRFAVKALSSIRGNKIIDFHLINPFQVN